MNKRIAKKITTHIMQFKDINYSIDQVLNAFHKLKEPFADEMVQSWAHSRKFKFEMDLLLDGMSSGKKFDEIAPRLGYSPEAIASLNEAAHQAVLRMEQNKLRYEKMTPEEKILEDERRIQAGVAFIMNTDFGGP